MIDEKGELTISSENIMPIIKKWMYSDSDIFLRELVSNAADAISKLKRLVAAGGADISREPGGINADTPFAIRVALDKDARTITVSDDGVGMDADEVRKYINQIAFSGAADFLSKYEAEGANDIIGHFGLGFYSAFMVAERVRIDSLSYREGADAVTWESDGEAEYTLTAGGRTERGTAVTLFVSEDASDFLDEFRLRSILRKYCAFVPYPIYFDAPRAHDHDHDHEHEHDHGHDHGDAPVNNPSPLWLKNPSDVGDAEYIEFFHEVFMDFEDPLFWIHLNMDYPFRLKGILYFPKLKRELDTIEGQVKLFSNQVFVADNIKEVIPEFLLLLKGCLDCPDVPLNVSRSFLQNDGTVSRMSGYITKKIADKLVELWKDSREAYNGYWEDINQFIKYGVVKDRQFFDKAKEALLFKLTDGGSVTAAEYLERFGEKTDGRVIYVTDTARQARYVKLFADQGVEAAVMGTRLDMPYMTYLESYDDKLKFSRIDAELSGAVKTDGESGGDGALVELFVRAAGDDKLTVRTETLKSESVPAVILLAEQNRRMGEIARMMGSGAFPEYGGGETLALNRANPIIKKLSEIAGDEDKAGDAALVAGMVYDLALLSHKPLTNDAMAAFIDRANALMSRALSL
ncbi:MAG: molecular chaperone HtpG [Clostridiales bacterium]|jgi:molecular chaperone HtpG|nr:molecular chaperone HtpG [Clostridiales bacterium]